MKLQSAIEYLTTYGWAIIIISIVVVALFEIVTSAQQPVQECILPAGFSCESYTLASNGLLTINLGQATTYPIQVTAMGCTNPQSLSNMIIENTMTANYISMPIGSNYIFTNVYCYSNGTVYSGTVGASTFSGYLEINYTNSYTGFPNTQYGTIRVEVTR